MADRIVRNQNYNSFDTSWCGHCLKYREEATVIIHLSGRQESTHDLQPSFTPHFKECSLLKKKGDKNNACTLSCPVFEAYKNSHSY